MFPRNGSEDPDPLRSSFNLMHWSLASTLTIFLTDAEEKNLLNLIFVLLRESQMLRTYSDKKKFSYEFLTDQLRKQ